jgi:hypothetical protein
MNNSDSGSHRVENWKEIASFLGSSVRTAQDWERKHGLPIHRLPGEKGRVWANTQELRVWLSSSSKLRTVDSTLPSLPEENTFSVPQRRWMSHIWVLRKYFLTGGATLLGCAGILYALAIGNWHRGRPSDARVLGGTLIVSDEANQKLWQYVLPGRPELHLDPLAGAKPVIADIDGDGQVEVLFPFRNLDDRNAPSMLYCFNSDGSMRWRRQIGREQHTISGDIYPADYFFSWITVLNKPTPGGGIVVAGAYQGPSALFCIELIDRNGQAVSDYYHFGWLWAATAIDLDGDGYDELVAGGVNDAYGNVDNRGYRMTLIAMDSRHIEGQGPRPEGDAHQLVGLTSGNERAVVFLPEFGPRESDYPSRFCLISSVAARSGNLELRALYNDGRGEIFADYEFGPDFRIKMVEPSPALRDLFSFDIPQTSTLAQRAEFSRAKLRRVYTLRNDLPASR